MTARAMDFACDRGNSRIAPDWLASLGPASEAPRWLLVDVALLPDKPFRALVSAHQWSAHSVFEGTALEAFGDCAPQLMPMPTDPYGAAAKLQKMMEIEASAPAFSVFESSSTRAELQRLFAYLGSAQIDGDLQMHCRFADTRVLPQLLRVLSSTQSQRVARDVQLWSWVDHVRAPMMWRPNARDSDPVDPSEKGDLSLDREQFTDMLRSCEPDTVFWQLLDNTPELVPETGRGAFRDHLQQILSRADTLHLETPGDRLQFAILSLGFGDGFYKQPILTTTWRAVASGALLEREMEKWEDDVWAVLEAIQPVLQP